MKKFALTCFTVYCVTFSMAQFGAQNYITRGINYPIDLCTADIDGDGDLDVVSASREDHKIGWYDNLGENEYGEIKIITESCLEVAAIHTGDFDGDGDIDIASASTYDSKIGWYENDGDGNFGEQIVISESVYAASSVFAVDLDDDGDLDMLSASLWFADMEIAWYENLEGGVFSGKNILSAEGTGGMKVTAIDMDVDGDLDVVAYSIESSAIHWYENMGDGLFGPENDLDYGLYGVKAAVGFDLDDDGDQDIVVAPESGSFYWYENTGTGFGAATSLGPPGIAIMTDVMPSDIDNDGDIDIVYAGHGVVKWYENSGDLAFLPATTLFGITGGAIPSCAVVEDMNADGIDDVVLGNLGSIEEWGDGYVGGVSVYENAGGAVFSVEKILNPKANGVNHITIGDLNEDGAIDVISTSETDGKIAWYPNLGGNDYDNQIVINESDATPVFTKAADIDGDGTLDILGVLHDPGKIMWYANDGDGNFGSENIISIAVDEAYHAHVSDLDGDGDLDVLSASGGDSKIAWYENLGAGIYGPQNIITDDVVLPQYVLTNDMDEDGDIDILFASSGDDKVAWFENDGAETFSIEHVLTSDANATNKIMLADMEGDGDLDVFIQFWAFDNNVMWFENLGAGLYAEGENLMAIPSMQSVEVADIDADNDIDIVAGLSEGNTVLYENLGDENYSGSMLIGESGKVGNLVKLLDIDEDGDKDLFVGMTMENEISWFKNYTFYPKQIRGQIYADLNNDGIKNESDYGVDWVQAMSSPLSAFAFTEWDGEFYINFDETADGVYEIFPEELDNWEISSDSLVYNILVDDDFTYAEGLEFGLHPIVEEHNINLELTAGFPRCNDTINMWLNIENIGTTIPSGKIHLKLADSLYYVSSGTAPDSISGQNYYWDYDSLLFFSVESINLQVGTPDGLEDDNVSSILTVTADTIDGEAFSKTDTLQLTVFCAYDPNDKTAQPAGDGEEGNIPPTTKTIEYLVRFQNTGTDTAINVVIKDQLDPNLDWVTLNPLASSHDMTINVSEGGEISFNFINIMLPDSNVNEVASHGFVKYSIDLVEGLPLGTVISNTAHIYFDLNPAVITNTKVHTLYLPDVTGIDSYGEEVDQFAHVYPNPFHDFTIIYFNQPLDDDYTLRIFNLLGEEVQVVENLNGNNMILYGEQFESGLYILFIEERDTGKEVFHTKLIIE